MKKILMSAVLIMLALFITACGVSLIFDSSSTASDDDGNIPESTAINGSSTISNDNGNNSESSTASISIAPYGYELPENFSISDYITDFDDAPLIGCSYINDILIPLADESSVEKAVEAYKKSEFYSEAVELANKMFRIENGGLVNNDDPDTPMWLIYGYRDYITVSDTIDFHCNVVSSVKYPLDGENTESIVLLNVPLPMSRFDSSSHAGFHVPVYINSDGEANILYDVCRQDYGLFKLIACSDGTVHALFGFGHNESGQQSAVYSFKNGNPELELSGCTISIYQGMLMGGLGWNTFEPFMFNAESGEFCALKAVPPSRELAEIICSDSVILTYVPNAREMYQSNQIQIIGGKYITFNTGEPWADYTFIYNAAYKCFERVEPVSVTGGALPEQITKSYNVKL